MLICQNLTIRRRERDYPTETNLQTVRCPLERLHSRMRPRPSLGANEIEVLGGPLQKKTRLMGEPLAPGEAQELMHSYFKRFGGIQDYLKTVVEEARDKGYTETILGRRRYLPDLTSDNRQRREVAERMALNAPIQGSAADIIKVAMLNVAKEIAEKGLTSRLLLQVHDELIFEVAKGEEEKLSALVRTEMENAVELSLPLSVNIGTGLSWDLAAGLWNPSQLHGRHSSSRYRRPCSLG